MKPASRDTHPDAERVQIELLRAAGPARRLALARSLSRTTIELSRRAIARARGLTDEVEVALEWASLHYGPELAARVRAELARRAGRP